MRPAAAFGKPFTYLAAAGPPSTQPPSTVDHRSPPQPSASVLHTFTPPVPPVRTSTATATAAKQKPPPVPPRGEQTRLTTVPARKKPEPTAQTTPVSPTPLPPQTVTPPPPPPLPPTTTTKNSSPQLEPVVEEIPREMHEDLSASALISKFENGCAVKSTVAVEPYRPIAHPAEVDSGTSTLAESTDDDDNGGGEDEDEDDGAADIWVRAIESPVKNPQKVRHHSDSAIRVVATSPLVPSPLVEKRGSLPADAPTLTVQAATENNKEDKSSTTPPPTTNGIKDSMRSSFRSTVGSRCSSPALSHNNKSLSFESSGVRKISAAEALGVVAKPCPRILPSSASLDAATCRRQSMGNLTAESRFGTLFSTAVRSSWAPPSGVQTDVESTQSEPSFDYRRKKFTKRCSSADGRNPVHHHHHHHHYHTLHSGGRAAAMARDPDFGAKRAFIQEKLQTASAKLHNVGIVPSGLPPTPPPPLAYQQLNGVGNDCTAGKPPLRSSTCNCGQHQATSRPMFINKRTVSAEELQLMAPPPVDQFAAGRQPPSSGRSQRVTFALDQQHQQQQQMFGASAVEPTLSSSSSASSSSAVKKPFKSNLKVKDTNNAILPELNVLGTSAINTRLPPQHPHPYGLPYKLPAVTNDVLQVVQNINHTIILLLLLFKF